MKIRPLWLDGPLQGTDHEIEYPSMQLGYQAIWSQNLSVSEYPEVMPSPPVHVYYFHKYAICEHIFIIASEHSDVADVQYQAEYRDRLLNMLLSDRAKQAEYKKVQL